MCVRCNIKYSKLYWIWVGICCVTLSIEKYYKCCKIYIKCAAKLYSSIDFIRIWSRMHVLLKKLKKEREKTSLFHCGVDCFWSLFTLNPFILYYCLGGAGERWYIWWSMGYKRIQTDLTCMKVLIRLK